MRKRFYRKGHNQLRLTNKVDVNNFNKPRRQNSKPKNFLWLDVPHYIVLDENLQIRVFENEKAYQKYKARHQLIKRYVVRTTKQLERRRHGLQQWRKLIQND